ncbi:ABC-2 transporter family protein [Granulicatella elegans]|uniref:ABC-2 transporter family protein n=1 Tax=Granulicatella elegans TaxID=137732 RepID=UPI001D13EA2A|nr:ABC-2 transporter family protein [Granulicatella elegans]UEA31077.1 ABC-2 transporter family protein [Granulicatella elegans]
MKQLFIFLFKKILKSRLNIAIIILLTICLSVSFYFNSQTAQHLTLENRLETHITENEKAIQKNEEKLSTLNDTLSDEYQFAKNNLELQKELLKQRNQILSLLEQQNWKEAYFLQWKNEERNYEIVSKQDYSSTELKVAINLEKEVYKSLYPLNIKAHNLDFPTYGIDQIVWVSSAIIPTLFLISIIFLITQLFTDRYKDGLDTSILLPFSRVKYAICTLGVGLSYVSLLYIGLCIFSLLSGIFNNGFGRLDYPYPILDVVSQNVSIVKIQDILFHSLMLNFLTFIVIVEVVYLVSLFLKQKTVSLFISLILIVGLIFGTNAIQPLQKYAHIIPFTYIRAVDILSGRFPIRIQNVNLNGDFGIMILPLFIVILFILIIFFEKFDTMSVKKLWNK